MRPSSSLTSCVPNFFLNLFNVSALEQIEKFKLPYHVAHKKTSYMNESGEYITPDSPNAYKFESFLFDTIVNGTSMSVIYSFLLRI